jgi:ABC-type antimicrobial peptide transport system permease subunit
VREIVAELDPDLPISQVSTLGETVRLGSAFFNVFGIMFTVFGCSALFLASVGLYGVLSFSVNQRRQELGVRIALGATRGRVVRWVLAQASLQLLIGTALGVVLSLALGRGLAFILFDVAPMDPAVLVTVLAIMTATGLVACLVPAARATRVDPAVAMHAP